jgi:acetyl-CoA C-acetyltransferase
VDTRTPVIAGAAQVVQRPTDWTDIGQAHGPIELMTHAATAAAADAGATRLLERVDWIGVVGGLWSYRNPGRLLAERLGTSDPRTCLTSISGSAPQELVGIAADAIAAGDVEVALVVGGEARATSRRLRALDATPQWTTDPGDGEPERLAGLPDDAIAETRALGAAAIAYALIEDSLRSARGSSVDEHRHAIAELWSRFSAVAADNPHAWDRTRHNAADIREASASNRMIAFPYTKALVANNTVDMASAVLLCSVSVARSMGISPDQLIFPLVAATSHETWRMINRDLLHEAPALAAGGRAALDYVGIEPGDLTHIDLYACFPSVVQLSAKALGIDLTRPLTVTGGLGFAGAPIANSAGQAIAAMTPLLRAGGVGMVHANGGNATKHAFGLYANEPLTPFRRIDAQPEITLTPRPAASGDLVGNVEAATVGFDRDGPTHVVAAIRTGTGHRGYVRSTDVDLINHAMTHGLAGMSGPLPGAGPLVVTG